jgi:GNAT superfamily N-acetyltransferase
VGKETEKPSWANPEHPPEFLNEWLFLEMDRSAMIAFLGASGMDAKSALSTADNASVETEDTVSCLDRVYVEQVIRDCLFTADATSKRPNVSFRLAGPHDVEAIARLVHQLAIYEKEPDAVNATAKDYLLDGCASEIPLFYCVLADVEKDGVTTTCGMGLFYLGCVLGEGRFLYLEDLFVEEAHRGIGGGKAIMERLAMISLALDCIKFTWTALDWNTPALNFYKKIDARIKDDLKITRYCGEELKMFAAGLL